MLEFFGLNNETVIIFLSSVVAAVSFMAFASIFLNREEQKQRYKDIVQKRRRDLFAAAREGRDRKIISESEKSVSARESMQMLYKMQNMLGDVAENTRDKMLQAGYRNPKAPINFMVARGVLPFIFLSLAVLYISTVEEPYALWVTLSIYLGAFTAGYYFPGVLLKNQIIKRQEEIELAFPDALDMMLICVQGGIGLEQTVDRISEEMAESSPTLAEELGILSAEMSMLNDRRTALQDFVRRVGSSAAKSFATALIQAEQYGTSVSKALKVLSEEMRDIRMQRAEEKAMSLPPKLTVPMIVFFLPSLFIVILGPIGIQASSM